LSLTTESLTADWVCRRRRALLVFGTRHYAPMACNDAGTLYSSLHPCGSRLLPAASEILSLPIPRR